MMGVNRMNSPAIAQLVESFIAEIELLIVARKAQLVSVALAELEPKKKRGRPPKLRVVR